MPPPTENPAQSVLERLRTEGQEEKVIDTLCDELETAIRQREEAVTELDRLRSERLNEANSVADEMEALIKYRDQALALLAETKATSSAELAAAMQSQKREIEKLKRQRKSAGEKKTKKSTQSGRVPESESPKFQALTELHQNIALDLGGELQRERQRPASELAASRDAHAREVAALANERDEMVKARNEIRDYLEVILSGHRQELDTLRQEHAAVLNERRETLALIERDRLSSRKQIELFTEERDTLVGEREEAISELAHERQTLGRQVELRKRESDNLAAQRTALLAQLQQLREAQKQQFDLFGQERQILIAERDAISAKLDQTLKLLGVDRVTLLQKKLDADARLAAAANVHRKEVESLALERDAALEERDAAVAELLPVRNSRLRETTALGTLTTSKYEASDTADHHLGGRRPVLDTVIVRAVEMKVCVGEVVSEAANAELLEEIRHLGRLQHPYIPPIYEAGLDQDGRVYYTIRETAGTSLRDILRQLENGTVNSLLHFTLKRLLGVFHKVCDAVAFAHAQGVTHGNLLPENIILRDFGDIMVTGWGLRRSSEVANPHEDTRADLMALGRLLYEIATLEAPPDFTVVRQEISARRTSPGNRERIAQRTPIHYWDADTKVKTLVNLACRALDRRKVDKFHSVREFQTQVDTFKDTFEDPARLTLLRLLHYWTPRQKAAAAIGILFLLVTFGALGFGAGQKYLAYRAHQLERAARAPKVVDPRALAGE